MTLLGVKKHHRPAIIAAPLMAVMMVIAMNPRIMGRLTLSRPILVVGWLATAVMALATLGFFLI